jgi:NitT/TauT family transport system substrate-binding protein
MTFAISRAALSALALAALAAAAQAETTVRVAWCAKTVSSAAAPFAIAAKMGWFKEAGIKVELVPFPGSTDCVKAVATKDVQYGLPSIEPVAIIRPQGVKVKNYYTAYQANIYGIAVPEDSPIKTFANLVARALARNNGFDPDKDVSIVVAGEAAQTAALLRNKQVDALSQFDTQYALTENAGVKPRRQPRRGDRAGARLCQGHDLRDRQSAGSRADPLGGVSADQADRKERGGRAA